MSLTLTVVTATGLAMDAVAVSAIQAVDRERHHWRHGVIMAILFGLFQALMPLAGAWLGWTVSSWLQAVDHWLMAGIFIWLGWRMLRDLAHGGDPEDAAIGSGTGWALWCGMLSLAFLTSIDAFTVGIGIHEVAHSMSVGTACAIIGVVTTGLCLVALVAGRRIGLRLGDWAQGIGGGLLLLMAVIVVVRSCCFAA